MHTAVVVAADQLPAAGARLAADAIAAGDRVLLVHRGALDSAQLAVTLEAAGVDLRFRSGTVELVHVAGGPTSLADAAARTRQYGGGALRLILVAATGSPTSCLPEIEDDVVAVSCLIDSSRVGGTGLDTILRHDAVDVHGQVTELHTPADRVLAVDLLLGLLRRPEDVERAASRAVALGIDAGPVDRILGVHRRRIEDRRALVASRGEITALRRDADAEQKRHAALRAADTALRAADGDVGALLATAAAATVSAMLLEDRDFHLLRWSDEPERPPPDLAHLLSPTRRSRLADEFRPGAVAQVRLGTPSAGTRLVMRLGEREVLGYLSVVNPALPDIADLWMSKLEAPLVAALRCERELGRVVVDLSGSLLSQLVSGSLDPAEALQVATHLGWRPGVQRRLAAVLWRDADPVGRSETLRDSAQRVGFAAGVSNGGLALLLDTEEDTMPRLLKWLKQEWSVSVGVGGTVTQPSQAARAFREAVWAARLAKSSQRQVVAFEELGIHRLLLPGAEAGDPAFEEPVRLLEQADDGIGFEPLKTLGTYLDCGGSPAVTARRLGLHVNSLRYRLKRIAQLSGVDLADPEQQFRLQLALRLRQARNALRD